MIVCDTQLLVYLTTRGPNSAMARRVRSRDPEWAAPFLWRSEFRSACLGMIRNDLLDTSDAVGAFARAVRAVAGREHHPQTSEIFAVATGNRITAYDLEFVAVARLLEAPLVTFDREVLAAFPGLAVPPGAFAAGA